MRWKFDKKITLTQQVAVIFLKLRLEVLEPRAFNTKHNWTLKWINSGSQALFYVQFPIAFCYDSINHYCKFNFARGEYESTKR